MASGTLQNPARTMMLYPSKSWQKLAFRAPLLLWRLGLGPAVGRVMIVITTTGHKSKLPRHNMTENNTINGKKYVVCAFGPKAAWYKNIEADPRVTVQSTEGSQNMRAVRVSDDQELTQIFEKFSQLHPRLTGLYLKSVGIKPDRSDLIEKKDRLYLLRFDPTNEVTPPGLAADLLWVWPVAGLLALLMSAALYLRRSKARQSLLFLVQNGNGVKA